MSPLARITLLSFALGLSACAVHHPSDQPSPTPPEHVPQPSSPAGKPLPRTSATFAPPPGGPSHWDARLGVYVLDAQPDTFYRQRTYYRWNNGWSRAVSPNGPWEETDISGVPPGLSRQFK